MSTGAAIRSKFAAFLGNGDISVWVKNSRVEQKTQNKRTNKSLYIVLAPTPIVSTGYSFYGRVRDSWLSVLSTSGRNSNRLHHMSLSNS